MTGIALQRVLPVFFVFFAGFVAKYLQDVIYEGVVRS